MLKNNRANACTVQIPPLHLHLKNVNFFIVKVLVKSSKGGCEVTLIHFYTHLYSLLYLSDVLWILPFSLLNYSSYIWRCKNNQSLWIT